jgi:hypothetical protein
VIVEDHRRKHVAVLGHGQCGHFQRRRVVEQLVNATSPIQQRILGMKMEMDEIGHVPIPIQS